MPDDRRRRHRRTCRGAERRPTGSTRRSWTPAARSSRCSASTRTIRGTDPVTELPEPDPGTCRGRLPQRLPSACAVPAALGGRRRRLRRRHRAPAPDPARRRRGAGAVPRAACPSAPATCATSGRTRGSRSATWTGSPRSTTATGWRSSCLLGDEIVAVGRYERLPGRAGRHHGHGRRLGRGRVRGRGRPPGPRARLDPARAPGRRGPGERAAPVRRRGARREPRDGAGLPAGRLPGEPAVRRRRGAPGVRHRPHRAVAGGARLPRAARRGPQRARRCCTRTSVAVDRGVAPTRPRSAHAVLGQPAARQLRRAGLPGATPRRGRCAGCAPTRRSPTSPTTSTSPSSPCRPRASTRSWTPAWPRACRRWSWSAPGSPRPAPAGAAAQRAPGRRRPARTACGWSGPNALGVANTDPRGPPQRHAWRPMLPGRGRVGFFCAVRRAGHRDPGRGAAAAGWGCRRSCRRATGPTSPATTCCSTGRPTRPPTSSCCTWRRSATRASSPGWRGGWPGRSRSWR